MVMMAAMLFHRDEAGGDQFGKMAAGGLRGNSRPPASSFAVSARRSISFQHVGPGRVSDKGANFRYTDDMTICCLRRFGSIPNSEMLRPPP